MSVSKTVKILALVIALLFASAAAILWLVDFSFLKPDIERLITEKTGRELHIDGDFSLHVLPSPTLLIENASLASPSWGSDPAMLKLGRAYVKIALPSLLMHPLVVKRLELDDVQVLVEKNSNEQLNWNLAQGSEPEASETKANLTLPLVVKSADVNKLKVLYRQPNTKDKNLSIASLAISSHDDGVTQFKSRGELLDMPLNINGQAASEQANIDASLGEIQFRSEYTFPGDAINFKGSFGALSDIGDLLGHKALPDEDLSFHGKVSRAGGQNIVLKDVVLALSGVRIALAGEVDRDAKSAALSVKIEGQKLRYLQSGLPAIPFSAESETSLDDKVADFKSVTLHVGASDISGNAHLEFGDSPALRAEVKSDLIELTPFFTQEPAKAQQQPGQATKTEAPGKYVFDESPLPLHTLQTLHMNVNGDISRVVLHNAEYKNLKLDMDAEEGRLNLTSHFADHKNGQYNNDLRMIVGDEKAEVNLSTKLRDFKLALLAGDAVPEDEIPMTNIDLNLRSSGSSLRTLAENLDGTVVMNQGEGKVSNELINRFSNDIVAQLFNALNPFAKKEKFTQWQCSLMAIEFSSGVGQINGLLAQSEKLMILGGGKIDLNNEALDIEFNTKPRKGVGVSADMFVTPFVKLAGTLAQPQVGLNNKGLLLSGGAAVLTGGMSFLYQGLMDRVTAEDGRCEQARSAIEKYAPH